MELEHSFTVPAGIQEAWATLLDVERIAPCMPGATLNSFDGEVVSGTVKVKVGPIVINYDGHALFRERDETTHTVVLEASGKETRAAGTASATVRASLQPDGLEATKVLVRTDLTVTGRPAKFGRGVISDVAAKLIGQFADSLAGEMAASNTPGLPHSEGGLGSSNGEPESGALRSAAAGASAVTVSHQVSAPRPSPEAINLVGAVAVPMLKRAALAVGGLFAGLLFWRRERHRRTQG